MSKKRRHKKPRWLRHLKVTLSPKFDPNAGHRLPPSGNKGKSIRTLGGIWKGGR